MAAYATACDCASCGGSRFGCGSSTGEMVAVRLDDGNSHVVGGGIKVESVMAACHCTCRQDWVHLLTSAQMCGHTYELSEDAV